MRFLTLIICLATSAARLDAAEHTSDSLNTVKQKLQDGSAVLIDVREKSEWEAGRLKDARLFPLSEIPDAVKNKQVGKRLPKDKTIYLHCAAGVRSLEAAGALQGQGYDLRPLKPGYNELLKAGFPKAKDKQ